uniref:Potassium voltage-gated channel, subfamily G, member 2 n=1 Tax=Eptatretus burgeri TaxID=7764 RepID=A0A8C4QFD4_EPTBU
MPILTGANDGDYSELDSYSTSPVILHHWGPSQPPRTTVKGQHYRRARYVQDSHAPDSRNAHGARSQGVVLNVGGFRYVVPVSTLADFPSSRLGRLCSCRSLDALLELCDDYDVARNEFFFDRHPGAFRAIMSFLRAGRLRSAREMCALAFRDELRYWGVDEAALEVCCRQRLLRVEEDVLENQREVEGVLWDAGTTSNPKITEGVQGDGESRRLSQLMEQLRDMVEDPQSGLPGKVFACLSIIFVAITAVSLCLSTMPDLRAEEDKGECSQKCYNIFVVETVCVAWFSFEFLLRLIQARSKWQFVRDPLNAIDVAAILPFYVTLIVNAVPAETDNGRSIGGGGSSYLEKVGLLLRVMRALRILYVMRLARHSLGLQTLGLTIRRCTRELGLLLLFMCVAMALFAPLVFLAETELSGGSSDEDEGQGLHKEAEQSNIHDFSSIPTCYWWAIISMTTVGYGDMVPRSIAGQVVALSSILSGILLMAFPVTSIFHTFSRVYIELREGQLRRNLQELTHPPPVPFVPGPFKATVNDSLQDSDCFDAHTSLIPPSYGENRL